MTTIDELKSLRSKCRYILELRYHPITQVLDQRGKVLEKITPIFGKKMTQWRVDHSTINLSDDFEQNKKLISIGHMKTSISYEDPDSFGEYIDDSENLLKCLKELFPNGTANIGRMGFRTISIFKLPKYSSYKDTFAAVYGKFISNQIPTSLKFEDFNLTFAHESCRIMVGPCKEKEAWVLAQFTNPNEKVPKYGVGIDIDSFSSDLLCKDTPSLINAFSIIRNLAMTSEMEIIRGLE